MITDLITQAQDIGIQIYLQDGQVKITLPWPLDSTRENARCLLGELRKRQAEVLAALDPEQQKYWEALLDNTKHLRAPQGGKFEPMTALREILLELKHKGAYLARGERTLILKQGGMSREDWQAMKPPAPEQLEFLLKLSLLGAAREYVDLVNECPEEWISEILGKHGARIASLRAEIIAQMAEKNQPSGLCFERPDGNRYYLVPCKTGRARTEITPEEAVIIAEAQDSGMLRTEPDGAWLWIRNEVMA